MVPIRHRDFQVREERLVLPRLPGNFRSPDLGHAQGALVPEGGLIAQEKKGIALHFGVCTPHRATEANKGEANRPNTMATKDPKS